MKIKIHDLLIFLIAILSVGGGLLLFFNGHTTWGIITLTLFSLDIIYAFLVMLDRQAGKDYWSDK